MGEQGMSNVSDVRYGSSANMRELSPPAVEMGQAQTASSAVRDVDRARGTWPHRGVRAWRFALLRRMLALADLTAGLLASVTMAVLGTGQQAVLAWALIFLPTWILVAKLLGLYDRDQRPLRHLTVDEAPNLILFALIGTSFLSFVLELTPAGRPSTSNALTAGVVAASSVFVLRALARRLWRAVTPPNDSG